jgi:hypothetical protein
VVNNGLDERGWYSDFESRQNEKLGSLETVLKNGFEQVTTELRLMREQGHIPLPVVTKIIDLFKPIIKVLCATVLLLVVWFTGVKHFLPQIFQGQ